MSRTVAETAEVAADIAPYLESWLEHQRRRARVPGVQAAVRVGDRLVLDTALGVADVGTGEPLTTGHLFRIASHSKTFTATAVLRLVEAGRMRLDDPIGRWVPALAGSALALSPVQASGSDPVVKGTTWDAATGTATVPARTVAVLVQR